MARLYQTGFELNSATSGMEWQTTTNSMALSSTTVRSGTYAGRANPTASTRYLSHTFQADTINTTYHRFYLNIATNPGATIKIWQYLDSANAVAFSLGLTSAGVIQMVNDIAGATVLASSSALSTATWYRIEVKIVDHATTSAEMELKIDGTVVSTQTGLTGLNGGGRFRLGAITGTSSPDLFFDDVAVNDTAGSYQNSYPGSGKIIHLKPNAAGDNTAWTGYVGSGANYVRVSEVPPDDATSAVQSRTTNQIDDYNVDDSGIGASDTVNVVAVGFRANRSAGTTSSTFNVRVKAAASGTVTESATFTASSTVWRTNTTADTTAQPYPIITYLDPDSATWTQSKLDAMQIGMKIVSGSGDRYVNVSNIWASVDYTPSTGTNITVSDTVTTSESTNVYTPGGAVAVNVSDSVTVTESVSVSISSILSITLPAVLTDELGNPLTDEDGNPLYDSGTGDFVAVSESVSAAITASTAFSVTAADTVTISESASRLITSFVSTSDTATLSEAVTLNLPVMEINVSDTITTSESVELLIPTLYIGVSDIVTTTESSSISVPLVGSTSIFSTETITMTENVEMLISNFTLNVSDSTTVTESQVIDNSCTIQISDTTTVTELNNFYIPILYINVSELILLSERTIVQKASGAGGLDTLTIELEAATTHLVIDTESPSITINATSTNIDLSAGSNSVILEA